MACDLKSDRLGHLELNPARPSIEQNKYSERHHLILNNPPTKNPLSKMESRIANGVKKFLHLLDTIHVRDPINVPVRPPSHETQNENTLERTFDSG